jgi:C4-dicarboxylate transporter DctM subunit
VAALGRLLHPELTRAGYSERFSLGLIASSAETALLIPPSITLIIYGWLTGTSIAALFAGGLAVGIVLGVAFMALVQWETWRSGAGRAAPLAPGARRAALKAAGLALGLPLIILGGIYSGVFTATEAAAVSAVYALAVELAVYRSFAWREVFRIAERSAVTIAAVFVLLAAGSLVSYFITLAQFPNALIAFLQQHQFNVVMFLLLVNVLFFIAGMFIDPNSILLVLVPTLYPAAVALGIDPVHFGLVVCLNICIGMITPPFGLDLFVASSTLNRPVETIVAGIWPFVAVNLVVLALITYVPDISTALPRLLRN